MKNLFIEYPKCTTCQKAKKWLMDNGIDFDDRHIAQQKPTADELRVWIARSGLPIKRFFNTSGIQYRELALKDKLPEMTEEEMIELLSTNGMLVKRPLFVNDDKVLVGFKEADWEMLK